MIVLVWVAALADGGDELEWCGWFRHAGTTGDRLGKISTDRVVPNATT